MLWSVLPLGPSGDDFASSVVLSPDQQTVFITGQLESNANFSNDPRAPILVAPGAFIAAIDAAHGTVRYARNIPLPGNVNQSSTRCADIDRDASGQLYLACSAVNTTGVNATAEIVYLVRVSPSSGAVTASRFTTGVFDSGRVTAVKTAGTPNAVFWAFSKGFGAGSLVLIERHRPNLSGLAPVWQVQIVQGTIFEFTDTDVDSQGNLYLVGNYFTEFQLGNFLRIAPATDHSVEAFLMSFNGANGSLRWVRTLRSTDANSNILAFGLVVDRRSGRNNVFLAGQELGPHTVVIGPGNLFDISNSGASTGGYSFVASFFANGGTRYAFVVGEGVDQASRSRAIGIDVIPPVNNTTEAVVFVGLASGTVRYLPPNGVLVNSDGGTDSFVSDLLIQVAPSVDPCTLMPSRCPAGQACCPETAFRIGHCYSPSSQTCTTATNGIQAICPAGQQSCSVNPIFPNFPPMCYNTSTQTCSNNIGGPASLICPAGQFACRGACVPINAPCPAS